MRFGIGHRKDPHASASYLSHFQLSSPPFATTAEGAFLFLDPERRQILDMLQHLTQYSDEVLLLSGEPGLGKSTLAKAFLQRAEAHWRCCHIDGGSSLDADQLFAHLARCFELNVQTIRPEELLAGIQTQLIALQEQRLAVLLVDDAQLLSDDALELILHLAQLEGEHGKLIRLLLFSEVEIVSRLAEPRFSVLPPAHHIELKPLTEEAAVQYVVHRLSAAGTNDSGLLDEREIRQIHRNSQGIPGAINLHAHQLLQKKYRQSQGRLGGQGLKLGIAGMAILGTVLGLQGRVHEWLDLETQVASVSSVERPVIRLAEQNQPWAVVIRDGERIQISCGVSGDDTVGVRPTLSAAALTEPAVSLARPLLSSGQVVDEAGSEAVAPAEQPPEAVANEAAPVVSTEPLPQAVVQPPLVLPAVPETPAEPVELVLRAIEPSPVVANQQLQRLIIRGQGFLPDSKLALSRAGQVEVLPDEQLEFIDTETLAMEVNTGASTAGWAIQLSTPDERRSNVLRFQVVSEARLPAPVLEEAPPAIQEPESVAEAAEVAPAAADVTPPPSPPASTVPSAVVDTAAPILVVSGVEASEWLAGQPAGNFTVQLMVSVEQESLGGLIARHNLPAPLAVFAMQRGDQQLYALTQGSYPNRAAAERAAAALPTGVQSWVRSIASVQEAMQQTAQPRPAPAATGSVPAPSAAATGPTAVSVDLSGVKDDAWVWSQDPARYTIQLAAAANEQTIREAMQGLSLPGERVVVQTQRDGRPWYVIIYGSFADRETARATIARLPPALQASNPWPRGFASLQDEMARSASQQ
ncbi:MAG: SPOR domain-containing protein [Thiohalomonadaceae bacterium]